MIWEFDTKAITFRIGQYPDGGTAIVAWDKNGVYATISINIPDAPQLSEGQFYLKSWSENVRITQAMIVAGIIEAVSPPVVGRSEFIAATAYQFSPLGMQYCQQPKLE